MFKEPTTAHVNDKTLPAELPGARIVLKPWASEDVPDLFAAVMQSQDRLKVWMPWAGTYSRIEHAENFVFGAIYDWNRRDNLFVKIVERETGRLLGGCGYNSPQWDVPSMEIGYWLREGEEGHGYVTEAVELLTDYAFAQMNANRVEIRCDSKNARSAAVPERLGWPREAVLRNHLRTPEGALRDTLVYALIRDDWLARSAPANRV